MWCALQLSSGYLSFLVVIPSLGIEWFNTKAHLPCPQQGVTSHRSGKIIGLRLDIRNCNSDISMQAVLTPVPSDSVWLRNKNIENKKNETNIMIHHGSSKYHDTPKIKYPEFGYFKQAMQHLAFIVINFEVVITENHCTPMRLSHAQSWLPLISQFRSKWVK